MESPRRGRPSVAHALLIGLLNLVLIGSLAGGLVLVATSGDDAPPSPGLSAAGPRSHGSPRAAHLASSLSLADADVPADPTPVFTEDFSHQSANAAGINILNYVGTGGMRYTADPPYTPAGNQCDGWVMHSTTPQPSSAQDSACVNTAWQPLQLLSGDLGLYQGQSATEAASNQVLSEYTNGLVSSIPAGYLLKTSSGISVPGSRYYAVSAYFAEAACTAAQALLTFSLTVNGTATPLSSGLNPCTAAGGIVYPGLVRVVRLQSAAIKLPAGAQSLGMQLYNAQTNPNGTDVAFDTPDYEFHVSNTGNVVLHGLKVTDKKLHAAGITVSCPVTRLTPGATTVCTPSKPYAITQADVDAGGVKNTATAELTPPPGVDTPKPVEDTLVTDTVERKPGVTFDKRVAKTRDVDGDGRLDLGDEIYYEFLVKNTGNVTLTHIKVSDPLLKAADIATTCTPDSLAPGKSVMCTADAPYVITAADVQAGVVVNSAMVHVDTPDGAPDVKPTPDTNTVDLGGPIVGPGGVLPNTGASSSMMAGALAGLLLTMAGLALLAARRRTRPQDA